MGGFRAKASVALLLATSPLAACAASWIQADQAIASETRFQPVPLYWFSVKDQPHLYRTEVDTPNGTDRVTSIARSSGYLYIWVDGVRVGAYAVPEKQQPDPSMLHEFDLTPHLTKPGKHVLTVSAPEKGFVLDGGFYRGTRRLAPLVSDKAWVLVKLPPSTVIEDLSVTRADFDGKGLAVQVSDEWTAGEDALALAFFKATLTRITSMLDAAAWRIELLEQKGIYISNHDPSWWCGAFRANHLKPDIGRAGKTANDTRSKVEALQKQNITNVAGLEAILPELRAVENSAKDLNAVVDGLSETLRMADERKMLALASKVSGVPSPGNGTGSATELAALRRQMESAVGHTLNRLNESRYDRLGWIPLPGLCDDDPGSWGIRVNPIRGATKVTSSGRWSFSTDPNNAGLTELRWSIGYNIENQWAKIEVGKPWSADPRFRDYRGTAWYRTQLHLPAEWAGNDVLLNCRTSGAVRLWWNDQELPARIEEKGRCQFPLSSKHLNYGADNWVALRIEGVADDAGLLSGLTASCPSLDAPEARATPATDVISTPLSPFAILDPTTSVLEIHHAPNARLAWKGRTPGAVSYAKARDGKLPANWVLLWMVPDHPAGSTRPLLLVFSRNPESIQGDGHVSRITFATPRSRVIAVRPWVKAIPKEADIERATAFWTRAALAVPFNYASVTKVIRPADSIAEISITNVPRGPRLEQTILYDYLTTEDDWGTEPLRLAPLPALCSLALDHSFRTLELVKGVELFQDGGLLAPWRGLKNADHISYRYDIEPYPRRVGFTSFAFSGADTGVAGNRRELELIAATGANSYRPQHNFGPEESPFEKGKTRVRVMVDACTKVGVNYTNNIDQTLGKKREYVRENYDRFMGEVTEHYQGLARQLSADPFWAVGYDLINEAFDHPHQKYNPALKHLTAAVRAIDPVHLCYIEPCESWGAIQQLALIEPTGDPLTLYSFHDYNFRLKTANERWPNEKQDLTHIVRMWLPAFVFAVKNGVPMHCGEFGGFHAASFQSDAQHYLMADFLRLFDQFAMHFHYYPGREVYERSQDGSLYLSNVVRTFRSYVSRPDFNAYYRNSVWPTMPRPSEAGKWAKP